MGYQDNNQNQTPNQGYAPPPPPPSPEQPPQAYQQQPYQQPPQGYPMQNQPAPAKGKSIASLILGIAGIVLCWVPVLPLITSIIGLVLGIQARKATPRGMPGAGLATAGFVVSIIGLVFSVIYSIVWLAMGGVICAALSSGYYYY